MNKKIILVIAAIVLVFFFVKVRSLFESDVEKIRRVIYAAKEATEKESALKCISFVSLDYDDKHGNNKAAMFFIVNNVFKEYDNLLIVIEDLKIEIKGDSKATAHIIASGQGRRQPTNKIQFLLDTDRVELKVSFQKEDNGWKVVELDFIEPKDFLILLKGL